MASTTPANLLNTNPSVLRIIATNENVTGPPGAEMLRRTVLKDASGPLEVLDNACGGGILTAEFLKLTKNHPDRFEIKRVVASDYDENMLGYVRNRSEQSGWTIEVMKIDQQSVPLPDNTFSHVFNNFGVFFAADDEATLSETYRITKPGGIAGFTSWKTIAWFPSLAIPAISSLIPEAPSLPDPSSAMPTRGWTDVTVISSKLEKAGFKDIQVSEYAFIPDVEAEPFAEACAVLIKAVTKKAWSAEDNQKYGDRIQPALESYLRENFPNGKWNGHMTAIISTGKKE